MANPSVKVPRELSGRSGCAFSASAALVVAGKSGLPVPPARYPIHPGDGRQAPLSIFVIRQLERFGWGWY